MAKPIKRSVAVVVAEVPVGRGGPLRRPRIPERLLLVQRPPDDEELPGAWGLPAASLESGEEWEEAVQRAGRDKLGVRLAPGLLLREGELERAAYRLRMRLYAAELEEGQPRVPQLVAGVTQYVDWEWAPASRLEASARRGSLCSRLCLAWVREQV